MANVKISELPAVDTPLSGTELIEVVQSGTNKKATVSDIGGSSYLVASVTLTDAQIKALPTTPVEIVAAPGVGKLISIFNAVWYANLTAPYTNGGGGGDIINLYAAYDGGAANATTADNLNTASAPQGFIFYTVSPSSEAGGYSESNSADMINKSIKIFSANGGSDYTGGNAANTLKVTVYYVVVDL